MNTVEMIQSFKKAGNEILSSGRINIGDSVEIVTGTSESSGGNIYERRQNAIKSIVNGTNGSSIGNMLERFRNAAQNVLNPQQQNGNGSNGADKGNTFEPDPEIKLVEPYNPTDPVVIFDPKLERTELTRVYSGIGKDEASDIDGTKPDSNQTHIDGVQLPIIQLNNTAVDMENIEEFTMKVVGFLPELELKIYDYDGIIKATDVPGMNNLITVVLLSPVEGTNKKISLDFYVTECKFNKDNTIEYKGVMNLNTFRDKQNKQIGSGKLTTYEMLEEIAKENKLGFAATENCKGINDKRYRQLYRETFKDFIEDQLSFAGTGSDTVIDAWVDEFGYLVMVNFSWVMSYDIDIHQLTIKKTKGVNTGSKQPESFDETVEETVRMISNTKAIGVMNNLIFDNYNDEVDNKAALEAGTSSKYYYLVDPCKNNLIREANGNVIEMSVDGIYDMANYYSENIEFIGIEFSDDDETEGITPKVVQKKNIENYKASVCNKTIIVEMPKANYLLQRGTLVAVSVEEMDNAVKARVIDETENAYKTEPDEDMLVEDNETEETANARVGLMFNSLESLPNMGVSGVYYIKDITFKYAAGQSEIRQIMTLVKKGMKNNLYNYATSRKNKL